MIVTARSALPFFSAILVGFLPLIAAAQLSNGELVRVKTVEGNEVIGTISEVTNDGLGVSFPSGDSQIISYTEMESLHRSIGRRTYRKRSALIGAGAGALTGIVVLFGSSITGYPVLDIILTPVFGGIYGVGGALVGVIVGSFIKGERWQEVFVPGMGSMSFEPRIGAQVNGRPVLGVRMVF